VKTLSAAALGLGALALAACTSSPPYTGMAPAPGTPQGECKAEPGQRFVGQIATGVVGQQLRAATGAQVIRWVPPRTAVTMDFRADRVTVSYDDAMVIERVACT
jgi:hypothetical protein